MNYYDIILRKKFLVEKIIELNSYYVYSMNIHFDTIPI